jgi:hypothetical protein
LRPDRALGAPYSWAALDPEANFAGSATVTRLLNCFSTYYQKPRHSLSAAAVI